MAHLLVVVLDAGTISFEVGRTNYIDGYEPFDIVAIFVLDWLEWSCAATACSCQGLVSVSLSS